MTQRAPRYQIERVAGSPDVERLQDRLRPLLERLSRDADTVEQRSTTASSGTGTAYVAADAADWSGSAPATVAEALDRLAAALGPVP